MIKVLNGAELNLFCHDTGLIIGRSILFFGPFLYLFQKPKRLVKENMLSKLLKVIVKSALHQNLPLKDSLIKMLLHAKLSFFA